MNVTFLVALWVAHGVATLVLAIYRQVLSAHNENDVVHLGAGEEKEIPGMSCWRGKWAVSIGGPRR